MIIYKVVCVITGDFYIGKTIQRLERRFQRHLLDARQGRQTHLCRAIRLYGEAAFSIEIVEETTDDLSARERHWIAALRPAYNMTAGGDGGDTSHSPNYKAALAHRRMRGIDNPNYGKYGPDSPNYGKVRTPEQRARIQSGLQRAWDGNENRRERASARISGLENNPGAQKSSKAIHFEGVDFRSVGEAIRVTGLNRYQIVKRGYFL